MSLEEIAGRTLGNIDVEPNGVKGVDLVTIITILKVIIQAYECFRGRPDLAIRACNRPSLFQKLWLRATVTQHVGLRNSARVTDGILATGRSLNYTELVVAVYDVFHEEGQEGHGSAH